LQSTYQNTRQTLGSVKYIVSKDCPWGSECISGSYPIWRHLRSIAGEYVWRVYSCTYCYIWNMWRI